MSKIIDCSQLENNHILVEENKEESYILLYPREELIFDVKDHAKVKIAIFASSVPSSLIKGSVGNSSSVEIYYADFTSNDNQVKTDIKLIGEDASINWHLAVLSKEKSKKGFEVSIYHQNVGTKSQIDNYGVCKDESKLTFSGICHILNGAHRSVAHQNAKIMVFDDNADAIAKPILKIDDNDIEASHSASVGKISDEEIFYLTSRGLSMEMARELITYGYLKPIIAGFDDEEVAKKVTNEIERGI